ncbi:hypothetical protein [Streptomyces silvensis]|uniref:Uncharacterized protein n=1 Tax=Streptomyces silvensis TaxID=1765722 RepID=A0A0W7X3L4_9ACTN|nr:hypothetical protein [Streptomyces silvensis]KUF17379.1 hypothetical protein AT728_16390 [Streptomyces silvensis]
MTTQLRTYRVWAAFEVPQGTDDTEVIHLLRDAFFGNERFTMRIAQIAEPEEGDPPTTVRTWARIDIPAHMTWHDIRSPLRELYQSLRYPYHEQSLVFREQPDDVDDIITARELRRGHPEDQSWEEPGRDQPAPHTLSFWWVSAPAEGQRRESAPKEGTYLARFQSRGALVIPAVGDTVHLFSQRVQVIARSIGYEYSDAYEYTGTDEDSDRPVCTEVHIDVYVETPLPKPAPSRRPAWQN